MENDYVENQILKEAGRLPGKEPALDVPGRGRVGGDVTGLVVWLAKPVGASPMSGRAGFRPRPARLFVQRSEATVEVERPPSEAQPVRTWDSRLT